jgi:GAF domain-containing protein
VPKLRTISLKSAALAVAAGLSFILLIGAGLWSQFHIEHTRARYLALSSARTVASRIDANLGDLKDLLSKIGGAVSTNPDDIDANDALLRRMHSELPKSIANIFVLTLDGRNIGNAVGKHASAGDRDYFQRALSGDRLVVGLPIRSRSDLGWVIPVAQPVFDSSGKMRAVLAVAIFADSLPEMIGTSELPERSVVRVVTENEIEVALFSSESATIAPDASRMGSAARQFALVEGSEVVNLHSNLTRIVGFSRTRRVPWLVTVGLPVEGGSVRSANVP